METQLLSLLDYRLRFTEDDACKHFAPFMSSVQYDIRQLAVSRVIAGSKAREMKETPLTPSPSINRNLSHTVPQSRPCTPQKRLSQGFLMPLLNVAKSHRSWTRCHYQQNSVLSNPGVLLPSAPETASNESNLVRKSSLPRSDLKSSNPPRSELANGTDLLTLSSTPSSSSGAGSQTTLNEDMPERDRGFNLSDGKNHQMFTAHPSVFSLIPPLQSGPLLYNCTEVESKPLAVKIQLDGFLRKMFGRPIDKPLGNQGYYGVEEKLHQASVPPGPFEGCLPVVPDQQLEPMVVC